VTVPHPRFEKLEPEKRQRILETAVEEFAASGYDGASLNRIIERMGLSKGVFYYYFNDKADLFLTVMEMVWDSLTPVNSVDLATLDGDSFWPQMEALLREERERVRARPWSVGFSRHFYNPPSEPVVASWLAEKFGEAHLWQARLLRRGQQVGAVRTDLPGELLLAILEGADMAADRWFVANWEGLPADETDRLTNAVFRMFRGMLEPLSARPLAGGEA
jgi:AcrR family transcriptional regulator